MSESSTRLSVLQQQVAWESLAATTQPALDRLEFKMKLLSSLSPDDTQTTEKLVDDILDSNSGVGVDLLSLHHAIVGSTTCYGQFSLLELCAQQSLELSDPVRIAASVNCVIDTLVLAQLCGIVLMANAWTHRKEAHLAVEMSKQLRDRLIAQRDAAQHLDIVYTYPNLSPSCKRTTQRRGNTANISLCQVPKAFLIAHEFRIRRARWWRGYATGQAPR
eukprot:TRINITY_DN143_c0_g2_i3.p1 TRINITY_DN143_c0_g2~~TRINITY_DN143_c0_g2_i3.p1  ORF type:complete len:219 (-),score=37.84 TRINITY_DN143_c0_g2_i3:1208-1864(-)